MADVLVVAEEALVSIGIKMILEMMGGFTVVAVDRDRALSAVAEHRPTVVLLDTHVTLRESVPLLTQLRDLESCPALAVLTTLATPSTVLESLRGGACGFLLKDSQPEQLVAAVRALASGVTVLAPEASSIMLGAACRGTLASETSVDEIKQLSDREQTIVGLVGKGLTNAEIARRLFISDSTVKEYVSVILRKLGVANRVQAAVLAYAAGLTADDLA
ncbi:LuxR C-terminal-related transcriptional regulator [Actinoplanes derwentensis]|uniref:DNA-binding response regulator, NarL/FixJ family, contains REC and HTH domains n=1 Tax=Actinoplanes derwentensis TaxID=113562 RepID=A0A1H2DET3_9ACTN|nr:response regulator transcription factor [Actinoplanes derwentensis]GID84826.1 DNA-binding response regulator [Actinoplanes derwentensis]SDT81002.1 DNA-binding response regulator, NarL/FixJ family, contains REC and HTH domains [Actinoplanes derwentensis]